MTSNTAENNRRIAKNTVFMFFRMLILILVNLYASRIILEVIGVVDYGIYNAVGGMVIMFTMISNSLSSAISRFITIELGYNNIDKLKKVFSTCVIIEIVLALILVVIAEIGGLWFLNNKMNIPVDRIVAANWVFHCSIITLVLNLLYVPYNAVIIAHEHMKAFAYVSIIEAILKLLIVFSLFFSPLDKLESYAVLLVIVAIIIRVVYGVYCRKHFDECSFEWQCDKTLLKRMFCFSGWAFFTNSAYAFNTQGVNILLNLFFGITVNAARGITVQIENVMNQFVTNFATALNPQIIKYYAKQERESMFKLICRGARFSYFLALFIAIPCIIETPCILSLWLKTVPDYTVIFVRLALIGTMINLLGNTSATAAMATGDIKLYTLVISGVGCLVFPLSYLLFYFDFPPETTYFVFIIIYSILVFLRIYVLKSILDFPIMQFMKEVIFRIIPVTILAIIFPSLLYYFLMDTISRLILVLIMSTVSIMVSIYIIGLEVDEKAKIATKVRQLLGNFLLFR